MQLRSGRKIKIYEVIKSDERRSLGEDSHEIFTVGYVASLLLIGITLVQWEAMQTMWNVIALQDINKTFSKCFLLKFNVIPKISPGAEYFLHICDVM